MLIVIGSLFEEQTKPWRGLVSKAEAENENWGLGSFQLCFWSLFLEDSGQTRKILLEGKPNK